MKSVQVSTDIVPVGELRSQAAKLLKRLKQERRPIVITQNGRPAGVLLSPRDFDQIAEHIKVIEAVRQGMDDVKHGRFIDDAELDEELENFFRQHEQR